MAAPPLAIEAEEFLAWMLAEKGRSANTLAAYRRDLRSYQEWLDAQETSIVAVDHETLVRFVGERTASDAATSTVARQLAAIRMLHRYLAVEGHRGDDPTANLEGVIGRPSRDSSSTSCPSRSKPEIRALPPSRTHSVP